MDYQLKAKFAKSGQMVTFHLPITQYFHDFSFFGLKFKCGDNVYDRCNVMDFRVYFNDVWLPFYQCIPEDVEQLMFDYYEKPLRDFGLVPGHINVRIDIKVGEIEKPIEVTLLSSILKCGPNRKQYVYKMPMCCMRNYDLKSGDNDVNCPERNMFDINFSSDYDKMIKIVCEEHKFVVNLEGSPKGILFFEHEYGLIPSMDMPLSEIINGKFITNPFNVTVADDCKLTVVTRALMMVVIDGSNVMCVM